MVKEKISKTIASRLKEARKEVGLLIGEAAERMGFDSYQTLSSIEKAERDVKAWELSRFAKLYHKNLEFFLGLEPASPKPAIFWRNRKTNKNIKEIENQILKYCNDYHNLEVLTGTKQAEFNLCMLNKKPNDFEEVTKWAEDTCKLLGLGNRPARSLPDVLEQERGIKVIYFDMGDYGSAASYLDEKIGAAIIINTKDAPWRRNYDIAHELFHLLTWDLYNYQEVHPKDIEKSEVEKFADCFASALLLPREPLEREFQRRQIVIDKVSLLDYVSIAREFSVSTIALLWRLSNLKYLSREKVQKLRDADELTIIDRKERQEEWDKLPPKSPRFVAIALICLQRGLISRGHFAEIMNINRFDIPEFLKKYGYSENREDFTEIISS